MTESRQMSLSMLMNRKKQIVQEVPEQQIQAENL